jgi:hypothetical protein
VAQVSTGLAAGQATAVSWRGSTCSSGSSSRGDGPLKMPMLQEPCIGGSERPWGGLDSGLRQGGGWGKRARGAKATPGASGRAWRGAAALPALWQAPTSLSGWQGPTLLRCMNHQTPRLASSSV